MMAARKTGTTFAVAMLTLLRATAIAEAGGRWPVAVFLGRHRSRKLFDVKLEVDMYGIRRAGNASGEQVARLHVNCARPVLAVARQGV